MTKNFGLFNSKLVLILLPGLLLSCGAGWQDKKKDLPSDPVEQARIGEYKDGAANLEAAVNSGNNNAHAIEMLYYSWIRQGEYSKALQKFEAWAATKPNVGGIRLAAARIERLTGNYTKSLTNL